MATVCMCCVQICRLCISCIYKQVSVWESCSIGKFVPRDLGFLKLDGREEALCCWLSDKGLHTEGLLGFSQAWQTGTSCSGQPEDIHPVSICILKGTGTKISLANVYGHFIFLIVQFSTDSSLKTLSLSSQTVHLYEESCIFGFVHHLLFSVRLMYAELT